jgi:hypothetical protein
MITEVARTVAKEMGFANTDQIRQADKKIIREFQSKIYFAQLTAEIGFHDHQNGPSNFISDRSIFDVVAYMTLYGLEEEFIKTFADCAMWMSSHYDLIIFCPVPLTTSVADDGFRLTDRESQSAYSDILKELLLTKASCNVAFLNQNRQEWLASVLNMKIIKRIGESA